MNSVMDCIQVGSLRALCKVELAGGSAVLSLNSHLQILPGGIGNHFAQQLSELRGMLSLFISSLLPVQADLRIALSVSNSCHCKIHTNFRALAGEIGSQIFHDIFACALSNSYNVLGSPFHRSGLSSELLSGSAADRALLRCSISFINITTYLTYEFHSFVSFSEKIFIVSSRLCGCRLTQEDFCAFCMQCGHRP